MGIEDRTIEVTVDFGWENVFSAVEKAIPNIKGMKIDTVNKIMKIINVKTGVSLLSWGENVSITLTPIEDKKTKISILSAPKTGGAVYGYTFDMGKNRQNIDLILNEVSKYL